MRGKVPFCLPWDIYQGITPAYAGKSSEVPSYKLVLLDHPRLCGEKYGYYTIEVSSLGSPPPMRGKDNYVFRFDNGKRITPAYAGKRDEIFSGYNSRQDHPRLCGEKRRSVGQPAWR